MADALETILVLTALIGSILVFCVVLVLVSK